MDYDKTFAKNKKFINLDKSLVKVSAGSRMINDRGIDIYSEFLLQKFLLQFGFTNLFTAFIIFFLRSFVFSLPAIYRSLVYKYFLRK